MVSDHLLVLGATYGYVYRRRIGNIAEGALWGFLDGTLMLAEYNNLKLPFFHFCAFLPILSAVYCLRNFPKVVVTRIGSG